MIEFPLSREVGALGVAMGLLCLTGCGPVDSAAKEVFLSRVGNTSITVFPAFVRKGQERSYNAKAAVTIGEFLTGKSLAEVELSDVEVPITGSWRHDQAKMLRESAEDFAAYLKEHPVKTEYALLPEYLLLRSSVGGIHCYVVDAENRVAFVVLLNSHWDTFRKMNPKTVDDCTAVLIETLREELGPEESGG